MPTSAPSRSIAVYRLHPVAVGLALFIALLLQTYLPVKLPVARLVDLPLLVTIYFSTLRRSKLFGIALGTGMGLAQDLLAHGPVGMFGMANALIGYLAAGSSFKFNQEQTATRFALVGVFVIVHNLFDFLLRQILPSPPAMQVLDLASAVLVNVALSLPIFLLLDHFRHPV